MNTVKIGRKVGKRHDFIQNTFIIIFKKHLMSPQVIKNLFGLSMPMKQNCLQRDDTHKTVFYRKLAEIKDSICEI